MMSAVISQDRGIVASNSTLHIANLTLNDSRPPVTTTNSVVQLRESLEFVEMDNRRFSVDDEQRGTCEWLLETTQWKEWQDSLSYKFIIPRLLWIKGKAGTGKSTVLKFAAKRGHIPVDGEFILMHFFNGRGTALERSVEGMYRTLLVQLLDNLPDGMELPTSIDRMIPRRGGDWHLGKLVTLFKAILRAQAHRPITCFVDALDECDDSQIRGMIKTFRFMIEGQERDSNRFRICFASRHYPHVSVPRKLFHDLSVEGQAGHQADLAKYIRKTLIIRDPSLAFSLQTKVQAKARGVFMWCNLVIATLNEKHDRGQLSNERDAEQILSELPCELAELYETMLGLDEDNSAAQDPRTLTCLQFVLLAKQGLNPPELWHAIQLGEFLDGRTTQEAANDLPSFEAAVLAILHISMGPVEVPRRWEKVQVVHESVRDFLLKNSGLSRLIGVLYGAPVDASDARSFSFDRLKRVCLEAFFTSEHRDEGLIRHTLDFALEYAGQASRGGIDQSGCLARIDDACSLWKSLRERFFNEIITPSLGTKLAQTDFPCLTRVYCRQQLKCDPTQISQLLWQSFRTNCYMVEQSTIRVLVEECCSTHTQGPRKHHLMKLAGVLKWDEFPWGLWKGKGVTTWLAHLSTNSNALATFILVATLPDNSIYAAEAYETAQTQGFEATIVLVANRVGASELVPDFKEDALRWAAVVGHPELVAQLLQEQAVNVNSEHDHDTALYLAIENEQQAVIDLLLTRADLDIHGPDAPRFTILQTAVMRIKTAILDQLLGWDATERRISPSRPDLSQTDPHDGTLLHFAMRHLQVPSIKIILRRTGSDLLKIRDWLDRTPHETAVKGRRDWKGKLYGDWHTAEDHERVVALLASASNIAYHPEPRDTTHWEDGPENQLDRMCRMMQKFRPRETLPFDFSMGL